jgi:hypothetical protein
MMNMWTFTVRRRLNRKRRRHVRSTRLLQFMPYRPSRGIDPHERIQSPKHNVNRAHNQGDLDEHDETNVFVQNFHEAPPICGERRVAQ